MRQNGTAVLEQESAACARLGIDLDGLCQTEEEAERAHSHHPHLRRGRQAKVEANLRIFNLYSANGQ